MKQALKPSPRAKLPKYTGSFWEPEKRKPRVCGANELARRGRRKRTRDLAAGDNMMVRSERKLQSLSLALTRLPTSFHG